MWNENKEMKSYADFLKVTLLSTLQKHILVRSSIPYSPNSNFFLISPKENVYDNEENISELSLNFYR